ncbi:Epidermal growth factor receptor kinase substrate 8, partial [Sarcoptes scabiei]
IWTQRMAIQLKGNHMWILDGETNDVVERFPVAFIQQPTSFNDQNHIYNNILIFTVQLPNENPGELHIFQCVSHDAINLVDDIYHWMKNYGVAITDTNNSNNGISPPTTSSSSSTSIPSSYNHLKKDKINNNNNNNNNGNNHHNHNNSNNNTNHHHHHHHQQNNRQSSASSNVNVKEAVNVFNQIAAQREKKGASTDSIHRIPGQSMNSANAVAGDTDSRSDSSSFIESSHHLNNHNGTPSNHNNDRMSSPNGNRAGHNHSEESYSNERYVSILNHCFDDIERFIIRLQHAAAALRELQIRSHKRGAKGSGDGLLAIRARGPCEEEFMEILSKFKLAFNLLAKLKGCIHDPNAPELVHFLFTPLAIIIEAARNCEPPMDPALVGIPYLSPDAIELLSNCCASKEFDLWQSLGTNWTHPIKNIRMTNPFQPVFTDGWAPTINEPELLGIMDQFNDSETEADELVGSRSMSHPSNINNNNNNINDHKTNRISHSHSHSFDDSDYEDHLNGENGRALSHPHHHNSSNQISRNTNVSPSPIESIDRDSPLTSNGIDVEQIDWIAELQNRNAKIVRVMFPRTANNNKELTVVKGEILEVLDDSRKWWKARNSRGQIAHVPHTIVCDFESSQLGGGNVNENVGHHHTPSSMMMSNDDWIRRERQGKKGEFRYF